MFEKNGRKNVAAWTEAVISGNPNAKVDVRVLEQITEQMITNDCRVIEESLGIIASTSNPDIRASRERLVQDRISHLRKLIPYADKKQAKEIQKVEKKCIKMLSKCFVMSSKGSVMLLQCSEMFGIF